MDRDELSRRHFTDSAQRVIRDVRERAMDRGMFAGELTEATAEMLAVLAIVRWERKVGLAALEQLDIDLDPFARELDDAIDAQGESSRRPEGTQFEDLPTGQRRIVADLRSPMQPLLGHAESEAHDLQHDWIGTEHLLLAAVRFACPRFRTVLEKYDVGYGRVRNAVVELLASG